MFSIKEVVVMGRRAAEYLPLPDGTMLAVGFSDVNGVLRCRFRGPDGQWCQWSTQVYTPPRWKPGQRVPPEALQAAAQLVVRAYKSTTPPDPKKVAWDDVLADLDDRTAGLRARTRETYREAVARLRAELPDLPGPGHLTDRHATLFARQYAAGTYTRGKSPDSKQRRRSPRRVATTLNNLTTVWGYFLEGELVRSNPWEKVKRPKLPKRVPRIPDEDTLAAFLAWLEQRYPGWELVRTFVLVKAVTGRRLNDLCQLRSEQLHGGTLTIPPEADKTHQELEFPLPKGLADALHRLKGPTWLWERYTADTKTYRPGRRRSETFTPTVFYNAVKSVFREYNRAHPRAKLRTHDLRRRALTLGALAAGGVDQTARAFGIDPQTARKFYVDAGKATETADMLRRVAETLLPKGG